MFLSDKLISCHLLQLILYKLLRMSIQKSKNRPAGRSSADIKTSDRLMNIDFDSWSWLQMCLVVDMALYDCRRSHCKFSGLKWFAIFVVLRPLPKHWKSTRWTSTCHGIASALKGQKPGVWHEGLWLQVSEWCNENGIMGYYWCSRLVRH